jgi:hypothetical protein
VNQRQPHVPAIADEIIDDRALDSIDQDLLGHSLVVDELVGLVLAVKTPATVALYGRWGSGKTSIQRLTAAALQKRTSGLRVATFNAFKYGEMPLRRHFLAQLAVQWNQDAVAMRESLYHEETRNFIEFSLPRVVRMLGLLVAVIVILQVGTAAVSAVGAASARLDVAKEVVRALGSSWAVTFPVAGIFTLLLALFSKTLPVTVKRTAPSSAEQFEQLFGEMVKSTGGERLVVLIDELDRCPAREVANTLETLRTFLDVAPCVFVVTADQQALETALTEAAKQTTPTDIANPYYSSGSAYLDKVFSYQMALPPLLPRRLSAFALALLTNRHGLWDSVDREDIVSILIPTHVTSPRRVKALLNAFVLSHRLAAARVHAGRVSLDLKTDARDLAKLVCLRMEFPLFAADLALDPKLPELVLAAERGESMPPEATESVWHRARLYSAGRLPLDTMLVDGPNARPDDLQRREAEIEHADGSLEDGDAEPIAAGSEQNGIQDLQPSSNAVVRQQFGQQLVDYLKRTEYVGPLSPSLIFLESGGYAFGLDLALADQLQTDALNGRSVQVAEALQRLQPEVQANVLRLLASLLVESSFGVELSNVVGVLAAAAESVDEATLSQVGDLLADSVLSASRRASIPAAALRGIVRMSRGVAGRTRDQLISLVGSRPEAMQRPEIAADLIQASSTLERSTVAALLAVAMCTEASSVRACASIAKLPEGDAVGAFRAARPIFADAVAKADAAHTAFTSQTVAKAVQAPLQLLLETNPTLASEFAAVALAPRTRPFRDAIRGFLGRLNHPTASLSEELLLNVANRAAGDWLTWLAPVDAALIEATILREHIDTLATSLWNARSQASPPSIDDVRNALAALGRLSVEAPSERPQLHALATTVLGTPAVTAEAIDAVGAFLEFADNVLLTRVAGPSPFADVIGTYGSGLLALAVAPQPPASALVTLAQRIAVWADLATGATTKSLLASATACSWLPPPSSQNVLLVVAAAEGRNAEVAPPLTEDQVVALSTEHGDAFILGLAAWLSVFARTGLAVQQATTRWKRAELPVAIARGLEGFSGRLTPSDRDRWILSILTVDVGDSPSTAFLVAIGLRLVNPTALAQRLITLYEAARTTTQRELVVRYWAGATISDDTARKELIIKVLVPIAQSGKGGWAVAMHELELASEPPWGTLGPLKKALLRRGLSSKERSRAEEALKGLGPTSSESVAET